MPAQFLGFAIVLLLTVLAPNFAVAQPSNEDRLREALRRTTAEQRALQDNQAALQVQLADTLKDRDALKLLLDQARAQSALAPAPPTVDQAQVSALRDALGKARSDAAALRAALAKWQAAYQEAAGLAQATDAEAKHVSASLSVARQDLAACQQTNTRVIATARDILHLYQTRGFRFLVLQSYEPLLGLKRVELENLVQDYEDRLHDGTLAGSGRRAVGDAKPVE